MCPRVYGLVYRQAVPRNLTRVSGILAVIPLISLKKTQGNHYEDRSRPRDNP